MKHDLRVIEDYLPIRAISAEASREKSVRKGHISTLHLWWARRPLVACRAAVYGALVPADRWVPEVNLKNPPEDPDRAEKIKNGKKRGLNRRAVGDFVTRLCRYPKASSAAEVRGVERHVAEAQRHILEAHADRLTAELAEGRGSGKMPGWVGEFKFTGERVTYEDIVEGRAPRPRVLDMFAGGGAIPLEALRLGCEAYALDLNPVAHIIELCTLVYPQKYGKPDPTVRGMTGPRNEKGETTWGGLAEEVRYWGNWVLEKVKAEIGDLYPPIPNPSAPAEEIGGDRQQRMDFAKGEQQHLTVPKSYLTPVAYLWTRTVRCKNPSCSATVPLVKRTWLRKKKGRFVALKMIAPEGEKKVRFEVVEAMTENQLGFDPAAFSKAGNATCPFCGTVADSDYVMAEGCSNRIGLQGLATVTVQPGSKGKVYVPATSLDKPSLLQSRIDALCGQTDLTVPAEPISPLRPSPNARGLSGLTRYGISTFGQMFTLRQRLLLLTLCRAIQLFDRQRERAECIMTYLALLVGRIANQSCALTVYNTIGEKIEGPMGDKKVPMVWDFPETNPFSGVTGSADNALAWIVNVCDTLAKIPNAASATRGDAMALAADAHSFDAIITDPPYYDNVPYADISDFFYVWFKRAIGPIYPEHFATELTPKKSEATALAARHQGDMTRATAEYEHAMAQCFAEANRVLKPGGEIAIVYAHKTTLGWATLVEALRRSGFIVNEAWPLDTEMPAGKVKINRAMLASSIFLIGRKRDHTVGTGKYEHDVQPELDQVVRERVETLWEMGITGADLVIAAVGAGLRAFTRFERVEYANGDEVPIETFLTEVEAVVLDMLMAKISGMAGGKLSAADPPSRFYVLWRYVYKATEIDAGEAIVFTYGQDVELDGADGLSSGKASLLEKKKGKYRLRDCTERGGIENLGHPGEDGTPAPLIDVLHHTLWLMENRPRGLREYLDEVAPNREQLRLLAAALAGPGLSGKSDEDAQRLLATTADEQSALGKLLANWKALVPDSLFDAGKR